MAKPAPISNGEFLRKAKALNLPIGTKDVMAAPRTFSSGSVGFGYSGKAEVEIDGVMVPVQVSLNITVIGSKPASADAA